MILKGTAVLTKGRAVVGGGAAQLLGKRAEQW